MCFPNLLVMLLRPGKQCAECEQGKHSGLGGPTGQCKATPLRNLPEVVGCRDVFKQASCTKRERKGKGDYKPGQTAVWSRVAAGEGVEAERRKKREGLAGKLSEQEEAEITERLLI